MSDKSDSKIERTQEINKLIKSRILVIWQDAHEFIRRLANTAQNKWQIERYLHWRAKQFDGRAELASSMQLFTAVNDFEFTVLDCLKRQKQHLTKTLIGSCQELRSQAIIRQLRHTHRQGFITELCHRLIGWLHSTVGRMPVCGQRNDRLALGLQPTGDHYVGKPSATGKPTGPTQPFVLLRSINDNNTYSIRTLHSIHLMSDTV